MEALHGSSGSTRSELHVAKPTRFTKLKAQASISITRIGESFKRKAVQVLSPPKSGPGSGLVKRAKTDEVITVKTIIPHNTGPEATKPFHDFSVVPKVPFDTPPLTEQQRAKAVKLGETGLLDIQSKKKATRQDFDQNAWQALDRVNFALTAEHLEGLCELFNKSYHVSEQDFDLREPLVAETLAKALTYTEDLDGKTLKVPVKNADGKYELKEFTISKVLIGDKLPCYVLRCEGQTPWIVPRGTEIATQKTGDVEHREGAMESILADCDPDGIGYKALESLDVDELFGDTPVLIAGHSLGGLIANELAARYPDKVEHAYGFSAPGISQKTFDKIGDVPLKNKITNFQVEGDLVPSAGRRLVGTNYAVRSDAKDAIHAHLEHNLNRRTVTCTLIDTDKENDKLLRRVSESTRKNVGAVVLKVSVLFKKAPSWANAQKSTLA